MIPEDFWQWLSSPSGIDFQHALIVLLLAVAGWFQWRTHSQVQANSAKLNGHLEKHVMQSVKATDSEESPVSSADVESVHNM